MQWGQSTYPYKLPAEGRKKAQASESFFELFWIFITLAAAPYAVSFDELLRGLCY
jgi:hypothetical protein